MREPRLISEAVIAPRVVAGRRAFFNLREWVRGWTGVFSVGLFPPRRLRAGDPKCAGMGIGMPAPGWSEGRMFPENRFLRELAML